MPVFHPYDDVDGESKDPNTDGESMPVFHPIDLVGQTFQLEPVKMDKNSVFRLSKPLKIMSIPLHWIPTASNSFAQSIMTLLRK